MSDRTYKRLILGMWALVAVLFVIAIVRAFA